MQSTELQALKVSRSDAYKAGDKLREAEELLSSATAAAGLKEGYLTKERNALRRLVNYADKVATALDAKIQEGGAL